MEPTKRKRAQLSSTGSMTGDVKVKKLRENLRSTSQRRMPARFNDFVVHATISNFGDGYRGLLKSMVKIPKNHAEALKSEYARKWHDAELQEIEALKTKGVLEEISLEDMPTSTNMLTTMWVYAVKTNEQGEVVRF